MQSGYFLYRQIFGIIKTNGLISLSKYPIKYLELVLVLTDFEITILRTLSFRMFIGFLQHNFFFLFLSLQISTLLYYQKHFVIIFYLIDTNIFVKVFYSSNGFDLYLKLI